MVTQQEAWLPVPGFEKTYQISNLGRVYSQPRPTTPGGIRTLRYDKHGYPYVDLYQDGKGTRWRIHILVAAAFIGPRPPGKLIRHLDGNPLNPTPANLVYGTYSENGFDSVRHGTSYPASRTHCPHGHEYDETNTVRSGGRRYCRACRKREA